MSDMKPSRSQTPRLKRCARKCSSAWAPLYRALRDSLRGPRYHRGMECIDVRSDAGSATARFADGSEVRGDLLIAAEGLRSAVRARLLPELQPAYAGYVAWRALMPESETVRATRDILERDYLFCVPEGSLALCYAVPARDGDLRVGHRDYNCRPSWRSCAPTPAANATALRFRRP